MKCRAASGCTSTHHDNQVACRTHWFRLPKEVRDEIWRLYRSAPGSMAHVSAVHAALESL